MTLEIGILLALGCAFATNLGFLYKYRGANDGAGRVDIAHPLRSAGALFRSKWFAIGMAVAVGAWILHVAALAMAPMSRRPVRARRRRRAAGRDGRAALRLQVGPRQWSGVGFTGVGLVLLGVTLPASAQRALAASRWRA